MKRAPPVLADNTDAIIIIFDPAIQFPGNEKIR